MENTNTLEERIKRAEEIYIRRNCENNEYKNTLKSNRERSSDKKRAKTMINQIVMCAVIYVVMFLLNNSQSIFSEEVISKTKVILSYNVEFRQIYNDIVDKITVDNIEAVVEDEGSTEEGKGGAEYLEEVEEIVEEETKVVKNSYIKPVENQVTSRFGFRDTNLDIPKNHTGIDLAGKIGEEIKSSTDGTVILVSEEGDYGKHIKIQLGEMVFIYAHCNNIYVKEGENVEQGDVIAEVGNTGNSTGPHLHFEIRINNVPVDPEEFIEF